VIKINPKTVQQPKTDAKHYPVLTYNTDHSMVQCTSS